MRAFVMRDISEVLMEVASVIISRGQLTIQEKMMTYVEDALHTVCRVILRTGVYYY